MNRLPICGLLSFAWMLSVPSSSAALHPPSPCPDIFAYEGLEPENNKWYGEISLRTDEILLGIRLDIELDRPSDLMVSWTGEITTSDNIKFTVLNFNQKLKPGPPVLSRIMVKFNQSMDNPKLRYIRLNGRKICPKDPSYSSGYEEESQPSQWSQSNRRPDPEFGVDEYPENANNHRNKDNPAQPTGSDYSLQDSRPITTVMEGQYTTRKTNRVPITTTTTSMPPRNPYEQSNGNRPNTNQNYSNKTVIKTVTNNQNDQPNGVTGSGGLPATTDGINTTMLNVNNRHQSSQQIGQKPSNYSNNQQVSSGGSSGSYTGFVMNT